MFGDAERYGVKPSSGQELFDAVESALKPSSQDAYGRLQVELPTYDVEWLGDGDFETGEERIVVKKGLGLLRRAVITIREDEIYDEIPVYNRSLLGIEPDEAWEFVKEVNRELSS